VRDKRRKKDRRKAKTDWKAKRYTSIENVEEHFEEKMEENK
jgi:hypothetical protein